MAKESRLSKTNLNMTACGKMASITVSELLPSKMETITRVNSKMGFITEKVKLTGLMELAMMVNFLRG